MNLPEFPGELPQFHKEVPNQKKAPSPIATHFLGLFPLKTAFLLSPILFLFGLPCEAFDRSQVLNPNEVEYPDQIFGNNGSCIQATFQELQWVAGREDMRTAYEGNILSLTGRFVPHDERRFTLIRYKINCCAADALPFNAICIVDPQCLESLPLQKLTGNWVEVTGKVQFLKRVGTEGFAISLILKPQKGETLNSVLKIKEVPPNPYLN